VRTRPGRGNDYNILGTRRSKVLFDYGRVVGIEVNKDSLALLQGVLVDADKGGYYEPGVQVLDNHVFNHGHKGFNLCGQWMVVRGNVNNRVFLKSGADPYGQGLGDWRLTLDGFVESAAGGGGMISDNYARAFDLGGRNLWIDSNRYSGLGSWPGNDGEGILCQFHNGTHIHSWAATRNVHEGQDGKPGYVGSWATEVQGWLVAWNDVRGWVGAVNPRRPADIALVANQAGGVRGEKHALTDAKPGPRSAPVNVSVSRPEDDAVSVTWTDTADGEIGFRVDRSTDGGRTWTAIAYRPPHIEGSPHNPQQWIDFLAPRGVDLHYRVAAIAPDERKHPDHGTSPPIGPFRLPAVE
jgi:hypothetical protein